MHLCVLMPDHLHALITFPGETVMRKTIADWKRFLATQLGINWQRDFFDHRLRREESFDDKAAYLRANPVRAGLVKHSDHWDYFWVGADHEKPKPGRAKFHGAPGGRALPVLLAMCCLALGLSARHVRSAEGETTFGKSAFSEMEQARDKFRRTRSRAAMRAMIPHFPLA